MASIRIALLSDLHFFVKDDKPGAHHSHLPITRAGDIAEQHRGPNKNPWDDLVSLIKEEGLTSDLVLCPGDITTRAESPGLKRGWQSLLELGDLLNAELVCAATGNHDISSRSQAGLLEDNPIRGMSATTAPIEGLKSLSPLYPLARRDSQRGWTGDRQTQTSYFGESFVLVDDLKSRFRLMIFNSCNEHGHDAFEYERGAASESSLRWIKGDVADLPDDRINILLIHHPLTSQTQHDGQGYDFVHRGDGLLKHLHAVGSWVVLHGHKHQGELSQSATSTSVPSTILSAASFSAVIDALGHEGSENQFYILDISRSSAGHTVGTIKAWTWNLGAQWQPSPPGTGDRIYSDCGFGCRLTPDEVATAIAEHYASGITGWTALQAAMPDLKYIMPSAMIHVKRKLASMHKLVIETDQGWYSSIARQPV